MCDARFSRCRFTGRCWLTFTLLAGLFVTLVGCGDGRPPTYPVQGSVRFTDGRPVRVGNVEFRNTDTGHVARGTIGRDGRFSLSTFRSNDGAVAGEHHVIVVQHFDPAVWKPDNHDPEHELFLVHPRFADYETSPLTATVTPQRSNLIELVVGQPAKKSGTAR